MRAVFVLCWGEKEEYCQAEVVAQHIAQEADGDAEDDDLFVVEQGGHEGHEWRRVDEGDGCRERAVPVQSQYLGEEYLQRQ